MEQALNNVTSLIGPVKSNTGQTAVGQRIKKYESLLHQIACSFGFSNVECTKLVQEACLLTHHSYTKQEISCPLKVFLAKCIIHKCIFKISSQLFSQIPAARPYSFNCIYTSDLRLQEMPFSLKVVYNLNTKFKFTEIEMAEILNTTQMQVKERLQKAWAFMKAHQ